MGAGDLIALIACAVAFSGVYLSNRNAKEATRRTLDEHRNAQDARITRLETQMEVFWAGIGKDLAVILHQPHPEFAERDALLEHYLAGDITRAQLERLREMLVAVIGDIHTQRPAMGERVAASFLVRAIDAELAIPEGG